MMDFYELEGDRQYHILLEAKGLIVMQAESGYRWRHGIAKRKSDRINGTYQKRSRRLSLTLRKVLIDQSK